MRLFWTPAPALLGLSLRRAVGPVLLVWCAAVAVLLVLRDWAPPTTWLGVRSAGEAQGIAHGLARQGIWSGVALAIVPFLVLRAARTVGSWRTGEVDWLASRATSRATILVWTWLGSLLAALLVLAATGVLAETRAGPGLASFRLAGEMGEQGSGWVEGRRALVWGAQDPIGRAGRAGPGDPSVQGDRTPQGSRARFDLALGSGAGPGAQVILRARRGADAEHAADVSTTEMRIGTRSAIEVELPPGDGDLQFELACAEDSARVFLLSKHGELWVPVASDRAAGWTIFARASFALAAWLALALGLGAWMQATSATALLFALMLCVWMAPAPSTIWPGGDLLAALAIAGSGRVPPAIDGRSVLASSSLVLLGLGLARWSLARWRRES